MATAYTSLLGLALPVTGELSGTWGDTVNNAITSLLDSAVAGTTTLSTDADVTLTTTTGATNQARQAILLCSGARTAIRNITAPAQSKMYVVINNTTGGYGVVIRGAGPTTGVTVANGKTAVVVWNGSDFVEVAPAVATNLSGGTAGALPYQTAANTTAFLSIGTNNFVLTSNGTAPVWTPNTGTGNVVRATSPTITTPTITTSITAPLLIGGTGTTSTLALRSTSGVGTTGADIIFQTGNNGATEAMRILNSGNVGIGTSSPPARLTVSGGQILAISSGAVRAVLDSTDANTGSILFNQNGAARAYFGGANWAITPSGSANDFALVTAGAYNLILGTNNAERLRIDSSGNLGVGTNNPSQKLQAIGAIESTASNAYRGIRLEAGTGNPQTIKAVNYLGVSYTADLAFNTDSNGVDSEKMRILGNGNVGIGTSSPSMILDVRGASTTSGASRRLVYISDTTTGFASGVGGGIALAGIISAGGTVATFGGIQAQKESSTEGVQSGYLTLVTNNGSTLVERMRIDSAGNVGIGTNAPGFRLDAQSAVATGVIAKFAATAASTALITFADATPTNVGPQVGSAGNSLVFLTNSTGSAAERMRIDSAGNVGIGILSPARMLHVSSTNPSAFFDRDGGNPGAIGLRGSRGTLSAPTQSLANDTLGAVSGFGYTSSSTFTSAGIASMTFYAAEALTSTAQGSYITFATTSIGTSTPSDRMLISSAGNVGIGTTSPVNKLDISGSFGRGAPVTKTTNFTLAATENWVICNGTGTITVTLPAASSWTGREVMIKTIAAQTVVSASSNVVPLTGGAAGTAILAATAGKWATLVSDGTNWVIMSAA